MDSAIEQTARLIHGDPIAPVILGVTSILMFAILGRFAARRVGLPTAFGEVLIGIVLGNVGWYLGIDLITVLREGPLVFDVVNETLRGTPINEVSESVFGPATGAEIARIVTGPQGGQVMQVAQTVDVFSRYGVIFLLFMVGLNTNLDEIRQVRADSIRVALIGVIAPFILGFVTVLVLLQDLPLTSDLFIAATLGATSIGITANVLKELGRANTPEGHIILGAAVGDDILGLIMLTVVSSIAVSGGIDVSEVIKVTIVSTLFLVGVIGLGPAVIRFFANLLGKPDIVEAKMFTSYLFVMILAWSANLAGLATIVGAFAAGVVISDSFFRHYESSGDRQLSIRELIMPLEVILVPIFFILMGIQVKFDAFLSWPVVVVGAGLLVAAVLGKLLSGLGARKPANKLIVGIGMMPRGEVGLVFAVIGRTLGVIDDAIFSAIVLMIVITTLIAPPLLKWVVGRHERNDGYA